MDPLRHIDEQVRAMKEIQAKLERDAQDFYSELNQAQNNKPSLMGKVASIVAAEATMGVGMEGVLHDSIARMKSQDIDTVDEYLDHLRRSIQEAQDSVSKVKDVISNLESCRRDISSQMDRMIIWTDKARDLLS